MTLISLAICLVIYLYLSSYPPFYVVVDNIPGYNGKWRVLSVHEDAIDDEGHCFKLRRSSRFYYSNMVILLGFSKEVFYIQKEQFETHRAKGRRWKQILGSWRKSKS